MYHRLSFVSLFACVGIVISKTNSDTSPYSPTWESLDARPLPTWYDDAKIGIFIHWGLFSVPSFGSEWFWNYWSSGKSKPYVDFMNKNFKPNFTYAEFAPLFTAEFYDPDFWADLFQDSGAKYIVFTSKHHEGFTMWPSIYSWNWNAMDVGPKRDLLGDLAASIRNRTKLRFGIYHSLYEWYNPLYIHDKKSLFKISSFVDAKTKPELVELVYAYKPEVIWSDGDWEASDTYWKSTEFLAWLYNDSPVRETVVVNDRWGSGIPCKHGGYYTCSDRFNPGVLQKHKWENCMTIDRSSWGYRRDAVLKDYMTIEDLIKTMIETISCGGNLLMNVGPTHDGRISPIFEERLRQIGQWLKVNGEAIYSSKPWLYQNDTIAKGVWYTSKPSDSGSTVYATVLQWPSNNVLDLGAPIATADTRVTMIGVQSPLQWKSLGAKGIQVVFPVLPYSLMPCEWAWVLKLEKLGNKSKQENSLN